MEDENKEYLRGYVDGINSERVRIHHEFRKFIRFVDKRFTPGNRRIFFSITDSEWKEIMSKSPLDEDYRN